jgi:hypothetical protein
MRTDYQTIFHISHTDALLMLILLGVGNKSDVRSSKNLATNSLVVEHVFAFIDDRLVV